MNEEDLKLVLAKYQQKIFELLNQNIVLETQVEKLSDTINYLNTEIDNLKSQISSEEDYQ